MNIGKCFPVVAGAATLMVVAGSGSDLTAGDAFGTLAVFQTLRVGMIMLPLSIVLTNTFLLVFKRVGEVLVAPEFRPPRILEGSPDANEAVSCEGEHRSDGDSAVASFTMISRRILYSSAATSAEFVLTWAAF